MKPKRYGSNLNCLKLYNPQRICQSGLVLGFAMVWLFSTQPASAGVFVKANDTTDLDLAGSWTAGTGVPGSADTALFDLTFSPANNNANIGTNLTWTGITVSNNLQSGFTINATGTNALTLGTGGINMSNANQNLTINAPVFQSGNETWNINAGQTLTFDGSVYLSGNYSLTTLGTGTINFNGNYSDSGVVTPVILINSNTVNINPGLNGSFVALDKLVIGNIAGSLTTVNVQSGTNAFNTANNYVVMSDNATATSILNITGGQLTINNGGYPFVIADKGTGTVNVANSTLIIGPTPNLSVGSCNTSASAAGATGTININGGGTVVVSNSAQYFRVGNQNSTTTAGIGKLNINNGGTLISGRSISKTANASGYVTFNGGTLIITTNSSTFMQGLTTATISTNGALINDDGWTPVIAQPLVHDATLTTDGGLTKQGTGTLTLSGTNTYNGTTTVNAGGLLITPAAAGAPGNYIVAGGAALKVKSITQGDVLGVTALNLNAGSSLTIDETNATSPILYVTNALTASSTVTLNLTNLAIANGVYPLVRYGSLAGSGFAAFTLGTVPISVGFSLTLSNDVADQLIDLVVAPATVTLTWDGTVNGNWDIGGTANWKTGAFYTQSGGVGPIVNFDDTATGPYTAIILNTTVTPFTVTVNNSSLPYSISGSGQITGSGGLTKQGNGTLTLATGNTFTNETTIDAGTLQLGDGTANNGSVGGNIIDLGSLVIANPNPQTMNNLISGTGSLAKTGNGTLNLTASNTVNGPLVVNAGTLVLNQGGSGGSVPVLGSISNVNVASGAILTLNGANALGLSNSLYLPPVSIAGGGALNTAGSGTHNIAGLGLGDGSGGSTMSGPGVMIVNGNVTNTSASVINLGSLSFNSTNISFLGSSASMVINSNFNLPGNGGTAETVLIGDPSNNQGILTTMGSGLVTRSYVELDWFTWNFDLGTNSFVINSKVTIGKIGGLPAYMVWNSGNGLVAYNNFFTLADSFIGTAGASQGELDVNGGSLVISNNTSRCLIGNAGTGTINVTGGSLSFLGNNTLQLGGDITYPQAGATGTLTISGNGSVVVGPLSGGLKLASDKAGAVSGVTGTINLNGGTLTTWPSIVNGATISANSSSINFNGGTLKAGTNNATFLQGLTQATLQPGGALIDDGGNVITIGQSLTDGGGGLTKLGHGTLILTNAETYSGVTTISNGVLEVDGSLTSSTVTVATAGILSGIGTLADGVTINAGGTLAAGTNVLGTNTPGILTINNNLALNGSLAVTVNKALAQSNSLVMVSGTLANGGNGTVTVTNFGPALAAGDTFVLFNAPLQNGSAMTIAGGGNGVVWANNLAANGSISVLSVAPPINPLPGTIQTVLSGNTLSLAWPTNSGWILQTQTNTLTSGLTTNWLTVPGSTSISNTSVTLNPANGAVFYRLAHP
jgi:autotransporter-associated beta strand protein